MGLFGQSSPFDTEIEKATSEKNTTEPWGVIMDICDKVGSNPRNAKDCLKAIMKRMGHNDPHVVIQAITLLDACVNNCGKNFHLEVASREFENEYKRLLSKSQPPVASKMRLLLKKWAENDFKADPQLNLIPTLYHNLKSEGLDFSDSQKSATTKALTAVALKDPNVVASQQEAEDIATAIELSLKENKGSPKKQQTTTTTSGGSPYASLYPSFTSAAGLGGNATGTNGSTASQTPSTQPLTYSEPRKVRALYDFEAAEDNELTFAAGEIIHVLDDSDPNWWKGFNQQGEGLFPSNFVTADLSVEPERIDVNQKTKKSVQFEDELKQGEKTDNDSKQQEQEDAESKYVVEINEEKIDRLLHLLHEANPEDPSQDSHEMLKLEEHVNKMGPLIDAELERVDRKHAQLTQLSSDLVDAINLYHTLMREPDRTGGVNPPIGGGAPMGPYMGPFSPQHPGMYGPPNSMYGPMGVPNMYHPGLPISSSSAPPNSIPNMPMIHMIAGGHSSQVPATTTQQQQQQQPQTSHPVSQMSMVGCFPPQGMVPMQFQNGHHPHQTSVVPPMPGMLQQQQIPTSSQQSNHPNFLPQQPQPSQQQQQQQANPSIPYSVPPNSYGSQQLGSLPPPPGHYQSQQAPLQQQQQQQQQPQQQQMIHHNGPVSGGNMMGAPPSTHPSHQQSTILSNPPGAMLPQTIQQHQHSQHMAAINQPVTQTILGQNDSKTNIPIYQQQR